MKSASHPGLFPSVQPCAAGVGGLRPERAGWRGYVVGALSLVVSACSTLDGEDRTGIERTRLPEPPMVASPPVVIPPAPPAPLAKVPAKPTPRKTPTREEEAASLVSVADAVPRTEALKSWANRPYVNRGRRYVPMTRRKPFKQRGIASWYGRPFHGRKTAIGERYDMRSMSAAHPTLPLPSYVRVTSVETGRSIVVRVNDRGPFASERVIDLSFAAAAKLGFTDRGVTPVEIELIMPPDESPRAVDSGAPDSAGASTTNPTTSGQSADSRSAIKR